MKKFIITMSMLLTIGMIQPMTVEAQKKNAAELTDSTRDDALEAYSDTTGYSSADDTTIVSVSHRLGGYKGKGNVNISELFDDFSFNAMSGMAFVLCVLFILFVISPIGIIIVLFYFINKRRKQKIQLAQMAVQSGQPIPQELLKEQEDNNDELWQKGMRQLFLGIGLMIFLGYVAGKIGFSIGALVALIGLGKLMIVKTSRKRDNI